LVTYPSIVLTPIAVSIGVVLAYRHLDAFRRLSFGLVCLLPVAALAIVPAAQHRTTGHWDAYYLAQFNYGYETTQPFSRATQALHLLTGGDLFSMANAPFAQTLLATLVVFTCILFVAIRWRIVEPFEFVVCAWLLAAWVFPATVSMSIYRNEAVLLPVAILFPRLPRPLAVAFCLGAVACSIPMTILFLRGALV
jgi:hypothetical protein